MCLGGESVGVSRLPQIMMNEGQKDRQARIKMQYLRTWGNLMVFPSHMWTCQDCSFPFQNSRNTECDIIVWLCSVWGFCIHRLAELKMVSHPKVSTDFLHRGS